ncbi:hypothetical protein SO802_006072 [Lithocarpus litseifolius]|uniref:Aspergillus nuclease S1 n=1 Tax=Lithocarpus litseifolius TaxID=425828 RepID=A0AAW2DLD2_9ROSI
MAKLEVLGRCSPFWFVLLLCFAFMIGPGAQGWSKGHIMTCRIAQGLLGSEALEAIQNLLPLNVNGDLSALCTWPDRIWHWHKYRWTSPLHFIDTPDDECTFNYRNNMIEAFLFLLHFMGDIHQGIWSSDVSSSEHCDDILSCVIKWAVESINIACKWGYKGVYPATTLADDYFDSRMPIFMKRIAQGGV